MLNNAIDLRSDTITQPTAKMRQAILEAAVGDDVFQDDPTILQLQERTADLLGKEAAIYVPSGTMSNQIALRVHCSPGEEFLCESGCHIYNYEQGGFAQLSGLVARTVSGEDGVLRVDQLRHLIRPENEHLVRTRLVCLENTHNRGAGRVLPYDDVVQICQWAHEHGLKTHLDGARIMNAAVASGISAARWAEHFDTVSICFSKGLGAPVGSALAGPRDLIDDARRHRKQFGGGMRQAGVIAAGALYALDHHVDRLADDHAHAQILAAAIQDVSHLRLKPDRVDTNIVMMQVEPSVGTAANFVKALQDEHVLALAIGPDLVRLVTNLHVTGEDARRAGTLIQQVAEGLASGAVTVSGDGAVY